jgi:hypothetical protein
VTEIAPLLIVIRLEEFDYDGAVAIAIAMLAISFALLLAINLIQIWSRRRMGAVRRHVMTTTLPFAAPIARRRPEPPRCAGR